MTIKRLWLIYEPPTTGANALYERFAEGLGHSPRYIHLGREGTWEAKSRNLLPFLERTKTEKNAALVIHGPQVNSSLSSEVTWDICHEGVFLRSPRENMIHYFHRNGSYQKWGNSRHDALENWMQKVPSNVQTRTLCKRLDLPKPDEETFDYDRLVRRLQRFQFVGLSENIDSWLEVLFPLMGVTAAPRNGCAAELKAESKPPIESPEFLRWINEKQTIDKQLYDHFSKKERSNLEWLIDLANNGCARVSPDNSKMP